MGNKTQTDMLKELVREQQEHIKKLEQQISYQDTVMKQYQSESKQLRQKTDEMIRMCSERLKEATALRDEYRNIVSETTQIKSEYDASLSELIASIRKYK